MAENQWTPVNETAIGWTPVPEEKSAARRFYEKTPIPGLISSMSQDLPSASAPGGEMAKQLAVNAGKTLASIPMGMAKAIWDGVNKDHTAANAAAAKGDYVAALGHTLHAALRTANPSQTMIEDTSGSVLKDIKTGNLAGAAGTLAPWVIGEAAGNTAKIAEAAKTAPAALRALPEVAGNALSDIKAGGGAFLESPKSGQVVPGTESLSPMLQDALALHPKTALVGNAAKRFANAKDAIERNQGSRVPAAEPIGGHVWATETPDLPVTLTPQQQTVVDGMARVRAAAASPAPVAPVNATMTPAEVSAAAEEIKARNLAARTAPPAEPRAPRVPLWQQVQAASPAPVSLASIAEMSPEEIRAAAAQRFADNRAARQAANPQGPAAMVDRLKALGATSDADQAVTAPVQPTPAVDPAARLRALADNAAAARARAAASGVQPETSSLPLGARGVAPLSDVAATPAKYTAIPAAPELSGQLENILDQLRAAEPAAEPATTAPNTEYTDDWKKTLDMLRAKKAAEIAVPHDIVPSGGTISENGPRTEGTGSETPAVTRPPQGSPAASPAAHSTDTEVYVPGDDRTYPARYKLAELSDLQASHNGQTFQANPKYTLKNDRDYTQSENQGKIVEGATPAKFRPGLHITDNPDASNGPPVVDSTGNVIGGNGRTMMLQRVYGSPNTGAADSYKSLLSDRANRFGIDPADISKFKQPVLVRQIADDQLAGENAQNAVTDFNKTGTAALKPSERIMADSRRVSVGTLDHLSNKMEAIGPSATLADVLSGAGGVDVYNRLVRDGIISPQEQAAFVNGGKLTPEGSNRISKVLLGRFFEDPKQLDTISVLVKNKLERVAAPLAKAEANPGWALTPAVQEAMSLIEETEAHGFKYIDSTLKQSTTKGTSYSPQAIATARILKSSKMGDLVAAARKYADLSAQAAAESRNGPDLFGMRPAAATPAEAFQSTFGAILPGKKTIKLSALAK